MVQFSILVFIVYLAYFHPESTSAEFDHTHLKIATIEDHPWVIKKASCQNQTTAEDGHNSCYFGFLIDLLSKIQEDLKFNYTLTETFEFGKQDTTKSPPEWTGLIGEITNGNADLALAALNITEERKTAIEFSTPFIDEPKNNKTFAFAFPKNSTAAPGINHMIMKLANQRHIEQLIETWFVEGTTSWSKEKALTKYRD